MREIINVQLGQCGNNLGSQALKIITQEHGINADGKYEGTSDIQRARVDVFFNELPNNNYRARTVLADLEPGSIDSARASPMGKLFNPDNFVVGLGSAGNNWAVGYYGKGAQLIDILLDKIRNQADQCDHLQGFQLMHSTSGGTGSGLGSLLIAKLKEEYPDILIQTFSVLPSKKRGDIIVDCYNATLSTYQMVQNVELAHIIQNEAVVNICKDKLRLEHPTYKDLNGIVSKAISSITCGLRFPGQINSNLRKQAVNLVPFPRIHFFIDSVTPLTKVDDRTRKYDAVEVLTDLFDLNTSSYFCEADPKHGRYMTASAIIRGRNISSCEVEKYCKRITDRKSSYFFQWIPDNIETSLCDISLPGQQLSGALVGNNTSIQNIFKNLGENFTAMFRKKAFLHWYTAEGMDEMEFTQAESNMNDLMSEYQPCYCPCEQQQGQYEDEEENKQY